MPHFVSAPLGYVRSQQCVSSSSRTTTVGTMTRTGQGRTNIGQLPFIPSCRCSVSLERSRESESGLFKILRMTQKLTRMRGTELLMAWTTRNVLARILERWESTWLQREVRQRCQMQLEAGKNSSELGRLILNRTRKAAEQILNRLSSICVNDSSDIMDSGLGKNVFIREVYRIIRFK